MLSLPIPYPTGARTTPTLSCRSEADWEPPKGKGELFPMPLHVPHGLPMGLLGPAPAHWLMQFQAEEWGRQPREKGDGIQHTPLPIDPLPPATSQPCSSTIPSQFHPFPPHLSPTTNHWWGLPHIPPPHTLLQWPFPWRDRGGQLCALPQGCIQRL